MFIPVEGRPGIGISLKKNKKTKSNEIKFGFETLL